MRNRHSMDVKRLLAVTQEALDAENDARQYKHLAQEFYEESDGEFTQQAEQCIEKSQRIEKGLKAWINLKR